MNEALRDFPDRLRAAVDGLSEDEMQRPEREGKWSIAQVIAHLAQFEMIVALRIRIILTADTPPLIAFDQERWARDVYRGEPVSELIEQLAFIRGMNLKFLSRLTDDEWNRAGIHPQYDHNTIRELIERFERHQEKHLGQVERIRKVDG
jgi:DinB superfamily